LPLKTDKVFELNILIEIFKRMEALIQCDDCHEEFNKSNKAPKILPKCGHTLCL